MHTFLARAGVRLLDFKQYAVSTPSSSNRARCKKRSISSPIPYVPNSKVDKDSPDVMRFLGRKGLHGGFQDELNSRLIRRLEGTRVKHWVQGNSIKMYDKAGNCLRVETTIATAHVKGQGAVNLSHAGAREAALLECCPKIREALAPLQAKQRSDFEQRFRIAANRKIRLPKNADAPSQTVYGSTQGVDSIPFDFDYTKKRQQGTVLADPIALRSPGVGSVIAVHHITSFAQTVRYSTPRSRPVPRTARHSAGAL